MPNRISQFANNLQQDPVFVLLGTNYRISGDGINCKVRRSVGVRVPRTTRSHSFNVTSIDVFSLHFNLVLNHYNCMSTNLLFST